MFIGLGQSKGQVPHTFVTFSGHAGFLLPQVMLNPGRVCLRVIPLMQDTGPIREVRPHAGQLEEVRA